ncbi:hypothetical protein GOP47_0017035 [Adiantum capillus-veneris]|uniref:eRF1/Pelota-like N-terminal domain-containing protein n=1 Tax=Adiantum capillus-veneris TaxID=13818 RepID=A0A9D4UIV7_ADICA|nr:hypothetical protein GOP47_0017035 [Adiantum capillus-veneris]
MKLLLKDLTPNGVVKLLPQNPQDLWSAYNLIAKGDRLSAPTNRKVQRDQRASGNSSCYREAPARRLHTTLKVEVDSSDYDNVANVLHVRGKTVDKHEFVKVGAYHTLDIEQQRPFSLQKDAWDTIAISILNAACDPTSAAIQEGFESVTTHKAKIVSTPIPQKHQKHPSKIMDTKAATTDQAKVLNEFFSMLSKDPSRVVYGPREVDVAHDLLAIQALLLTEELFQNANVGTRKKYANLVHSIKENRGEVHIFSSMQVSGEKLGQLSGIAAILRFPLPDLEDMDL